MDEFPILVCFAVKEEAVHFRPGPANCERLITGMGRKNAAESIRRSLDRIRPSMVITAGFAGALNPELTVGTVVFDEDFEVGLTNQLLELNAVPAQFHCARRVAVTAAEKQELWKSTRADAVEMESAVIRTICKEYRVPSATIRVISDAANEDLPLDFNALMDSNDRIDYLRLVWQLFRSPRTIPQLIKFQEKVGLASRNLGNVLNVSLPRCSRR